MRAGRSPGRASSTSRISPDTEVGTLALKRLDEVIMGTEERIDQGVSSSTRKYRLG
jgi:hypothetical protein